MKKGIIITSISILLFLLSCGIGFYFIKIQEMKVSPEMAEVEEKAPEENTIVETVEANTDKVKITPNTKLILKRFYSKCNHTLNSYVELPAEFINLEEEELKENYPEWTIQKFTKEEVVLLKEEDAFCNQHYILKEKEGMIAVYKVKESGEEILIEITGISTEYLTESDLLNLQNGIKVYGIEELNKTLEDYE